MALPSDDRALWLSRCVLPHERRMRIWLMRQAGLAGHDVDDIVQETYAVLAAIESVEHIRDPMSYMFQTAKSILLQQLRRGKIVSLESLNEANLLQIPAAEDAPDNICHHRQALDFAARLIARFPLKCRQAFTLRKVYGMSQREISQRLGVSENTVEKHIAKGLRLLMDAVKQGGRELDGVAAVPSKLQIVPVAYFGDDAHSMALAKPQAG